MSLPKEEGLDIETFLISIPSFLDQGWCYFIQENQDNYFERVVQLVEFEGLDEHWNFSTVFMMRMMVSFIIDIREDNSKNTVSVKLSKSSRDDATGKEVTLEVAIEDLDVMIMELKNYSLNGWNDLLSRQVANETLSRFSEGSVQSCGVVKLGDESEDNYEPMPDSELPIKMESICARKKDKSDDCVPELPLSYGSESVDETNDISILDSGTPVVRRSFRCKQCNRSCRSRKALTLHVCGEDKPRNSTKFHHETEPQSSSSKSENGLPTRSSVSDDCFVCRNCQQSFESSMKLAKHRYRNHGKGSLPAHCNVCQKDFATKIRLLGHTRMHHPNDEDKDVNCDQCWKTFRSRPRLIMHKWRQHGNGKNRRYVRKIDKPAEGVYAYYCDQCPKAYRHPASLRAHKKGVHSNKPKAKRKDKDKTIDESERTCKECGKVLLHRYALNRHVKSSKLNILKLYASL